MERKTRIPQLLESLMQRSYEGPAEITPDVAALVVAEQNTGNRRVRKNLVQYLVSSIENGEWQSDHPQPIVFSSKRLIDGQHRLIAIANAGKTVTARVITGARDELREYIDTGISRNLEDRVAFNDDYAINRRVAQIVNTFYWIVTENGTIKRPTPTQAFNLFVEHERSMTWAASLMTKGIKGVSTAPVMCALVQMHERDSDKAEEFAAALHSPDSAIQQASRLRDFLRTSMTGGQQAARMNYQRSVGAMKAYLEGRTITALRAAQW